MGTYQAAAGTGCVARCLMLLHHVLGAGGRDSWAQRPYSDSYICRQRMEDEWRKHQSHRHSSSVLRQALLLLLLVQVLAAVQALGDLEGLTFGADGGSMGGQVARGG